MASIVIGIVHHHGKVAFLQRQDGTWTFPSGKVEARETLVQAVIREVAEETGLEVAVQRALGMRKLGENQISYFQCGVTGGELSMREPDKFKFAGWQTPAEIYTRAGVHLHMPVFEFLKSLEPSAPAPAARKLG